MVSTYRACGDERMFFMRLSVLEEGEQGKVWKSNSAPMRAKRLLVRR